MPQAPDLAYAIGLPPQDAINYFRSRGYRVSANAMDAWQAAQDRAFTVTGVARLDMLQDIHSSLLQRLQDGDTFSAFKRDLNGTLQARGWARLGRGTQADADTGEVVANLPPRRLQTIFRTNMQSALMTGKYKQLVDQVDVAPYWEYVAVMDRRTRPAHAAANGLVFRYDDPFWNSHYPPCGYNCRCGVRALSDAMVKARNLDVLSGADHLEEVDQPVGQETRPAVAFTNPTTKERFIPGPGFGRRPNLGEWAQDGLATALGDKVEAADPGIAASILKASPRLQEPLAAEYRQWAQGILDAGKATNSYRVLGTVSPTVVQAVKAHGVEMASAALAMRDTELLHLARDSKAARGAGLPLDDILNLPALLASAPAVLWDHQDPALVYVLRLAGPRAQKAVVRVNWAARVRDDAGRQTIKANVVRTAGQVQTGDLQSRRYEIIDGSLDQE